MRHRKRKSAAKQALWMSMLVVAALAALIVLAFSQVFVVRDVMVVGNRNLLREEVVTQSGVQIGDNLLGITDSSLRQALEQNRYIEYLGHGFDYRGTLTLRIKERLGMAVVYDLGYYYVLDASGVVLECAGSVYPTGVAGPRVTGLGVEPNSRVTVGEYLPVRDTGSLKAMEAVLAELEELNMLGRTSELSVKNTDNLYILTEEGAKIELGDTSGLKTKLLIAGAVLTEREEQGDLMGAKIDVSNGKNAHYIPAVLPTVTPTPTTTPSPSPTAAP